RYQRELYAERVARIKALMPDCCIGVDVIVGFPGESREDFLETYHFLNGLDISYLHVFTYSERENTIAAQMEGAVPGAQRGERGKMLHILSKRNGVHFIRHSWSVPSTYCLKAMSRTATCMGSVATM